MSYKYTAVVAVLATAWVAWVGFSLTGLDGPGSASDSVWRTGQDGSPNPPEVAPPPMASGPALHGQAPPREKASGRPAIPQLDLSKQTPAEAIAEVTQTPKSSQWMVAFALGEVVGDHYGNDLARAREFSDALPEQLRTVFYNGLGHTLPWDVEQPDVQVAAIQDGIPDAYRKGAYLGMLIRYTVVYGDDPAAVVEFATEFSKKLGIDAKDGVRIGNQIRFGEDVSAALAVMRQYPEEFQIQMAEELGWRAGTDRRLEPKVILPLVRQLEGKVSGRFVHGVCRGGWNPGLPTEALRPLLGALPEEVLPDCLEAVSFALAQAGWKGAELREAVEGLHETVWIEMVLTQVEEFSGHEGSGWRDPDMDSVEE